MNPRFCSFTGARRASARVAMTREATSDIVKSDDVNANYPNRSTAMVTVKARNRQRAKSKRAKQPRTAALKSTGDARKTASHSSIRRSSGKRIDDVLFRELQKGVIRSRSGDMG
jgi:hypothetical protein